VVTDFILTIAAWLYLRWRVVVELLGFTLMVAAAALVHAGLGLAAAGVALLLVANYSGRPR
jgi:hypothetical protein